jgi:hypothetical protein
MNQSKTPRPAREANECESDAMEVKQSMLIVAAQDDPEARTVDSESAEPLSHTRKND